MRELIGEAMDLRGQHLNFSDVTFPLCRWGNPDHRPAGPIRESCDTAAGNSIDGIKRAGPDSPAAWHLYCYTAESADPHLQHPHHPSQICAYWSNLWM